MHINTILLMVLASCSASRNSLKPGVPDQMTIYSLPLNAEYIVAATCERFTQMGDLTATTTRNVHEVSEFYAVFNDPANFEKDTSALYVDSRLKIEFSSNGKIIKTVCWSRLNVEIDGTIFKSNAKVTDFLLSK